MYFIECHSRAFNLAQLSPVVVSGSVRSTPCQVSTEANNKATGTVRRNQAKPEFGAFWGFSSDSRISLPACCTTCVASEPASSTPAYLPELTTAVAENIDWNCRYLQKWLVEQRLWVCHRFQTRSLHDFLILHAKMAAQIRSFKGLACCFSMNGDRPWQETHFGDE